MLLDTLHGVSKYIKGSTICDNVDFTFEFIMRPSMAHSSLTVQERGKEGTDRIEVPYFCKKRAFP